MSERKVINKFYAYDYDPKVIKKLKQKIIIDKQEKVRNMMPFTCKCMTCGHYLYKGSKFNMRKEDTDEDYMGIPIYRFF